MASAAKVVPTAGDVAKDNGTTRTTNNNDDAAALTAASTKSKQEKDDAEDADNKNAVNLEALANEEPDIEYNYYGSRLEATLAGCTIVLGGLFYGWTAAFAAGFGSYFTALLVVGVAYTILLASLGELTATLAFPGGTYGLARVVLGFYPGYLIGFFEVLEYVFMTTASVTYCGEMFLAFIGCDPKYTPAMWFIFYGFAGLFTLTDARTFWISSNLVAIVSLLMIAIYVFGSLKYANLAQNGPYYNNTGSWYNATAVQANLSDPTLMIWNQRNYSGTGQNFTQVFLTPSYTPQQLKDPSFWFIGGMATWVSTMYSCTASFAGVEALPLLTSMVKQPKETISFACMAGVLVLFACSLAVTIVAGSMPPGLFTTAGTSEFMTSSYLAIFPKLDANGAWAFILPAQFGMAYGFIMPTSKLLQSLATSNLLPSFFMLRGAKTNRRGIIMTFITGYVICLIGFYVPEFAVAQQPIAVACGCVCYLADFAAYYKIRTTFGNLPRDYRSPFGLYGSYLGALIMALVLISTLFFQSDGSPVVGGTEHYVTVTSMCIILGALTFYYEFFARKYQTFSKDEERTVFRLHVIIFNARKMKQSTRPGAGKSVQTEAWKKFKKLWLVKKILKVFSYVRWFIKHVIILRDASEILVKKRYKKTKKAVKTAVRRVSKSLESGDLGDLVRQSVHSSLNSSTEQSTKVAIPMTVVDMTQGQVTTMTKHGVYTGSANFLGGFKTVAAKAHVHARRMRERLRSISGASSVNEGSVDLGAASNALEHEVVQGDSAVDPARPRVVDPFAAGAGAGAGGGNARAWAASRKDGLEVQELLAGPRRTSSAAAPPSDHDAPRKVSVQHSNNASLYSPASSANNSARFHGEAAEGGGDAMVVMELDAHHEDDDEGADKTHHSTDRK